MITLKRAYDDASASDGYRVLVDRLWPRGIKKEQLALDLWLKDVAPSTQLRQWFKHDPEKFDEFKNKYKHQLGANNAVDELKDLAKKHSKITLVYAAKDPTVNHAAILKDYLES